MPFGSLRSSACLSLRCRAFVLCPCRESSIPCDPGLSSSGAASSLTRSASQASGLFFALPSSKLEGVAGRQVELCSCQLGRQGGLFRWVLSSHRRYARLDGRSRRTRICGFAKRVSRSFSARRTRPRRRLSSIGMPSIPRLTGPLDHSASGSFQSRADSLSVVTTAGGTRPLSLHVPGYLPACGGGRAGGLPGCVRSLPVATVVPPVIVAICRWPSGSSRRQAAVIVLGADGPDQTYSV